MNYCRKCQSDYEKPGTCNCFAPQAATPAWTPWYPIYPSYTPWWSTTPPAGGSFTYYFVGNNADLELPTTWVDLSAWGKTMMGGDTSGMLCE